MSLLETIRIMWRDYTLIVIFLVAALGVAMIACAMNIEPIFPVLALFIGFCLLLGAKI